MAKDITSNVKDGCPYRTTGICKTWTQLCFGKVSAGKIEETRFSAITTGSTSNIQNYTSMISDLKIIHLTDYVEFSFFNVKSTYFSLP